MSASYPWTSANTPSIDLSYPIGKFAGKLDFLGRLLGDSNE